MQPPLGQPRRASRGGACVGPALPPRCAGALGAGLAPRQGGWAGPGARGSRTGQETTKEVVAPEERLVPLALPAAPEGQRPAWLSAVASALLVSANLAVLLVAAPVQVEQRAAEAQPGPRCLAERYQVESPGHVVHGRPCHAHACHHIVPGATVQPARTQAVSPPAPEAHVGDHHEAPAAKLALV